MKSLLAFRNLFLAQARGFALALLLSLVTLAAGTALLGVSGWFITAAALTSAGLAFNLFVPSALVRAFSFIRILARYGERLSGHDATLRLLADLRGWLFARLFPRLPLADRSLRHGDLVSRLTADIDALDTAFLVAIGPVAAALVIGTALTALLAWLLPGVAPIYAICFALAVLAVPAGLVAASRHAGQDVISRAADARAAVLDGIEGHADLTVFGVLGKAQSDFVGTAERLAETKRRLATLTAIAGFAVQSLAALALAGALWRGLDALDAGTVGGPILAGLLLAIAGSFEATSVIVRSVGKLTTAMAAAERLTAIADCPIAITDPAAPAALPGDPTLLVENICFALPNPRWATSRWAASPCLRFARLISMRQWRCSARTARCSTTRSGPTCCLPGQRQTTRRSGQPLRRRASNPWFAGCPAVSTALSAKAGAPSRWARPAACAWRGCCCRRPESCCLTSPRQGWIVRRR
jgi:ATP-binding cassette subfamily C protein CydC